MERLITFSYYFLLFFSCSEQMGCYNPKAIEFNDKAVELMQRSEYDSALILFDKAIEIDKIYYLPHSNKTTIYVRLKQLDKALHESEMVVKKKPDLAEGWTLAGMLHDRLNDTLMAMKYYNKSIEIYDERILDPKKKSHIAVNKFNRAVTLILLGKEKEGKDEMLKLKLENPDDLMIDEFIDMNKEEYIRQIIDNEQ